MPRRRPHDRAASPPTGAAPLWPENSLLAFRNALALGADYLEFDVHLTRDGEVVVIHDATLDRTTTGTGPVRERTAAELAAPAPQGPDGRGHRGAGVPTLDEVVALAAAGQRQMLLEIKTPGQDVRYERRGEQAVAVPGPRYDGLERKVLDALRGAGMSSART